MMMDKCIVLNPDTNKAECKTNRDVRKGDLVVTGERGIRIIPQERPREGVDIFQFMSQLEFQRATHATNCKKGGS